jgi:hypothetical protein
MKMVVMIMMITGLEGKRGIVWGNQQEERVEKERVLGNEEAQST